MSTSNLTVEQLQKNLLDLADRIDTQLEWDDFVDALDIDDVGNILRDLVNGRSGHDLADLLDLASEGPPDDEEEEQD